MSDEEDKPNNILSLVPTKGSEDSDTKQQDYCAIIKHGPNDYEEVIFNYHGLSETIPNMIEFYEIIEDNQMRLVAMANINAVAHIEILTLI